jgi:hypothetical protein
MKDTTTGQPADWVLFLLFDALQRAHDSSPHMAVVRWTYARRHVFRPVRGPPGIGELDISVLPAGWLTVKGLVGPTVEETLFIYTIDSNYVLIEMRWSDLPAELHQEAALRYERSKDGPRRLAELEEEVRAQSAGKVEGNARLERSNHVLWPVDLSNEHTQSAKRAAAALASFRRSMQVVAWGQAEWEDGLRLLRLAYERRKAYDAAEAEFFKMTWGFSEGGDSSDDDSDAEVKSPHPFNAPKLMEAREGDDEAMEREKDIEKLRKVAIEALQGKATPLLLGDGHDDDDDAEMKEK